MLIPKNLNFDIQVISELLKTIRGRTTGLISLKWNNIAFVFSVFIKTMFLTVSEPYLLSLKSMLVSSANKTIFASSVLSGTFLAFTWGKKNTLQNLSQDIWCQRWDLETRTSWNKARVLPSFLQYSLKPCYEHWVQFLRGTKINFTGILSNAHVFSAALCLKPLQAVANTLQWVYEHGS
jgi:hypothetical protein